MFTFRSHVFSTLAIHISALVFILVFSWPLQAQEEVLFEEHFDDNDWASRGWYDGPDMIVDGSNRVGESGGSAVFTWQQGATTAASRGGRVKFEPVEGFTMTCYMKFSDNWEWTNLGYHPHLNLFMTNKNGDSDGPAFTHLTLYVEVVDGYPKLLIQDGQNMDQSRAGQNLVGITENRSVAGGNGDSDGHGGGYYKNGENYWNDKYWSADTVYFTGDETGPFYKNEWHKVEAHFQLNSVIDGIGVANGVLRLTVNDSVLIEHRNVLFRTGANADMKIDQYLLLPYFGPGVPHSQSFWIDEIRIVRDEEELPAVPPPVQPSILFEEDFDNSDWASGGWYDEPGMITDGSVYSGESGSSTRFDWTAGASSPATHGGRRLIDPVEGLTVSYDIRFSDDWDFTPADSMFPPNILYFITNAEGQWGNPVTSHLTLFVDHMDGRVNLGMRDILNIDTQRLGQDLTRETEIRAVAGGNGSSDKYPAVSYERDGSLFNLKHIQSRSVYFSDSQGDNYKGDWHRVVAHVQLNSIVDGEAVANGVVRLSFDGEQVLNYTDVVFRTGQYPSMKINQLLLLPYLVGGAPGNQSLWLDNLEVAREEQDLPVPEPLNCDFNGDGHSNVLDVISMLVIGRLNPQDSRLDWNGDGEFSVADVLALLLAIVSGDCG